MMRFLRIFPVFLLFFFLCAPFCLAQARDFAARDEVRILERRIQALEDYVQQLQPSLNDFSENLIDNVNYRFQTSMDRVVLLNPVSREVRKIVTNTGILLISVRKQEKIKDGYRLFFNLGNPTAATYSGISLRLKWGRKWDPQYAQPSYKEWRESLTGAEYEYPGDLLPGAWTEIVADLTPAAYDRFEHIECEMDVNSVNLIKEP